MRLIKRRKAITAVVFVTVTALSVGTASASDWGGHRWRGGDGNWRGSHGYKYKSWKKYSSSSVAPRVTPGVTDDTTVDESTTSTTTRRGSTSTTVPVTTVTTVKPTTVTTKAPTTVTTKAPTTTTTKAPTTGSTSSTAGAAASAFNWGTPAKTYDFNDLNDWWIYDAGVGDQWGRRLTSNVSVSGGLLTAKGSAGTSAGMKAGDSRQYGRWEVRMKVTGDQGCWRPVLLLWPTSGVWPSGGEVDYAEQYGTWSQTSFNLHYGAANNSLMGYADIDYAAWNDFAVEWTSKGMTGYLNGKAFFNTTNTGALPPGPMQPTIQLDGSTSCNANTQMVVDWMKIYSAS